MTFPCSDPVHAGNAGNIPAGIVCSFGATGFGRSIIPPDLTAWERKTMGKQTFPRESFVWEREIGISTGNVWDGNGHPVNWLSGSTGTIFARERELIPIPVKSCGNIPAGIFPRAAL